ncbi:MAG: hypothetical protein AB8G86_09060, partial [Saprospiraceae bacterium]
MKIKILLLAFCSFLMHSTSFSQVHKLLNIEKRQFNKADPYLKRTLIRQKSDAKLSNSINAESNKLKLVIESQNEAVKSEIESMGGSINTDLGKYFTIEISKDKVL